MAKHILCDISDVAEGKCNAFTVEGQRIAVYNINGSFYATQNHCTHKGAQLVKGELSDSVIECPQHGWKFDVTTGKCVAPSHGRKLKIFPVSIERTAVVVELENKEPVQPPLKVVQPSASTSEVVFFPAAKIGDILDDEVIPVTVDAEEIALYRVEGELFATQALCTHEKVNLCDGFIMGDQIECPLHGACFNIRTGKVLNLPAEVDLKTYPVKLEGETVLVGIEK